MAPEEANVFHGNRRCQPEGPTCYYAVLGRIQQRSQIIICKKNNVSKLFRYINVKNYYFNIFKKKKHNTTSTTTLQTSVKQELR